MNNKLRLQILKRDNHTCQICFITDKKLQVHHVIPRRFSGSRDVPNNLVSVCHICHEVVEYIKLKVRNSKNKTISIKVDAEKWAKLKARAYLNQRTIEDEFNIVLEKYTEEIDKK